MTKQVEEYPGRSIHNPKFYASLTSGRLSKMLTAIQKLNENQTKGEEKLDVQIRNNYLNIYYRGSNAGRVKSENSIEFDEFYFYNTVDFNGKTKLPKKKIAKDEEVVKELREKRDELKRLFKKGDYDGYFSGATTVIDHWLDVYPKPEREIQHKMVACQTLTGYTIIDIEFQVSERSLYKCEFVKDGATKCANPRFDIIAVNTVGELCVIELKKGPGALKDTSGLKEHWDCFKASIGDKSRNKEFIDEVKNLLIQKQKLGLIKKDVSISCDNLKFLFAYEYKGNDHKMEENAYNDAFQKIPKDEQSKIKTLWLENGVICK
jgi:hypothetical protein